MTHTGPGSFQTCTDRKLHSCTTVRLHRCLFDCNAVLLLVVVSVCEADLQQPGELGVSEGDMGGVGVSPGVDAHA